VIEIDFWHQCAPLGMGMELFNTKCVVFVVAGELSLVGRVRYIVGHDRQADNCHPENMS